MTLPKFLYHGTSKYNALAAMSHGLKPRGKNGQSNWTHSIESSPDNVYLTDTYPSYFAINAIDTNELGQENGVEAAVLQIDVSRLNLRHLVPDEDVLEQAGRGHDRIEGDMIRRTRHYRKLVKQYKGTDVWTESLQAMGTCAHIGIIPPEAISRVAFFDIRKAASFTWANMDAMICLANYRFCGSKYRNFNNLLFDLPEEADTSYAGLSPQFNLQQATAKAVMIEELNNAKNIIDVQLMIGAGQ